MKRLDDMRIAATAFWQRRSREERVQIGAGGAVAIVLILVFGVLLPLQEARQRLSNIVAREQARTASMKAISAELARLTALPRTEAPAGETLKGLIEASAHAALSPAVVVVTPETGGYRLHATGVTLEQIITWIDNARQNHQLRLLSASIRPDAGATCTVSLLLAGAAQ